ncbi:MAG: type IX secretion system protein PorQ [Bacteroidales bacterium]|nr:type IX secretion system protein PorQ [Bacteroidales bacterium]
MRRYIITLLVFVMALGASAQQANGTYSFLRASNSARVAALGGLPLPLADGNIEVSTFNPSAIDATMHNKLSLSYVDYFTDINYVTAQYSRTFEKLGSFVGTVQYFNYGRFVETSEGGVQTGEFSCSDYAATLGWGRQLTPNWRIGAALKYAGHQYESYSGGALAVDVAGSYLADNGWVFALTARNLGVELFNNFDYHGSRLPFSMDFGASKKLDHLPLTVMLWYDDIQRWNKLLMTPVYIEQHTNPLTGEFTPENAVARFARNLACHFVVGGELALGKNIALRSAFDYGQRYAMDVPKDRTLVGFSVGVAVKVKMFEISYARSRQSITASPNYLTISMDLNKF